jgi:hypothetical protein
VSIGLEERGKDKEEKNVRKKELHDTTPLLSLIWNHEDTPAI